MKRKHKVVIVRLLMAVLIVVISLVFPIRANKWLTVCSLIIPYLIVGYDILWSAIRNIFRGQLFDENFLMAIATVGAFGIGEYYEAVGVMIFYQTGELFQSIAVGKSRRSIAELMDIRPDSATVLRDGCEQTVFPDEIAIDEIIIVRVGEKIALDGEIIEGVTAVDTAALTGESLPVDKKVGDKVISGSVNMSGVIKVRVEKLFAESTVSKILELVEDSAAKKAKSEKFITRFARYYTPCVVVGAILIAVIPPVFFGEWSEWIRRSLVFLMISCPCALVVSVPLSFFGGIGGASRKGILIKGANYIEALAAIDCVMLDKTGTLTVGEFCIKNISAFGIEKAELLEIAAHAESFSIHPIAESIVREYGEEIDRERIGEISELAGMGVRAVFDGKVVSIGNLALMERDSVEIPVCELAGTVIHISRDGKYLGYIVLGDRVKNDAKRALEDLGAEGIKETVMLTGDSRESAETVGRELGVDKVYSELFPSDKVRRLEEAIAEGRKVCFVGDGINDAPVLSRADVGIAMGAMGSDAAIEAADVVIMDDSPLKIAVAIKISRKTMRIVRQNIVFALSVKGVILFLGALGWVNLWVAIFGDVGVMILAVMNAMRSMRLLNR